MTTRATSTNGKAASVRRVAMSSLRPSPMNELHEAALDYHRRKLPITLCRGKAPFPKGWPAKRWTIREIEQHFRADGNLNVGTRLGPDAGIVDVEYDSVGGERALLDLFDGDVPVCPTWMSPRSPHRLFRWHPDLAAIGKASVDIGPLEIRLGANGKGAQSLLPPSVTDGFKRKWQVSLDECDPPALPDRVVQRLLRDFPREVEEADHRGEGLTQTHSTACVSVSTVSTVSTVSLCKPALTLPEAIHRTLPSEVGHRRGQIFAFVRHLKALPQFASADFSALLPVVQQWHHAALPFIGTKDFDTTFSDFADAWMNAKYAIGQGPLKEVCMTAITKPLPKCAERYKCDSLRRMVLLCRELQHHAGNEPFYLACRSAGDVLGITHVVANKWLRLLVHERILELVTPGTRHRASEYRYIGGP